MLTPSYSEHPFAQYIRLLGKGRQGSRHLTQEEAYQSMKMVVANQVEPIQLGAFLMLMRVKEETSEELAGFTQAIRDSFQLPSQLVEVDLDWSSYAGKRRHLPWFILSARLLAQNGIKVFMHGTSGHTKGRIYTDDILPLLGIKAASSLSEAAAQIQQHHFAYLPLRHLCPKLQDLIELRPLLGLRSPMHTVVRLLNPFNAPYVMQGIFHPNYRSVHQEAALLLKYPYLAVIKGDGGEIERDPDVECLVQGIHDSKLFDELWPAMFKQRHSKEEDMQPQNIVALWRGDYDDDYAIAAVIGTAAIALKLMQRATTIESAQELAQQMWNNRLISK